MILKDVAILAVSSNRTLHYLRELGKRNLLPAYCLYLFDPQQQTPEQKAIANSARSSRSQQALGAENPKMASVLELLSELEIPYESLPTLDPNAEIVVSAVESLPQSILIYSGPGGALLRKPLLQIGKQFLHIHPGLVPDYRGSTTIFYSLLREGSCGATALLLNEQIDAGPIVRRRTFPPPEDRTTIDLHYDPDIRAKLLGEVLEEYSRTGQLSTETQGERPGETYFIIHPVLKHIAILSNNVLMKDLPWELV